jgi:hypothetical protein
LKKHFWVGIQQGLEKDQIKTVNSLFETHDQLIKSSLESEQASAHHLPIEFDDAEAPEPLEVFESFEKSFMKVAEQIYSQNLSVKDAKRLEAELESERAELKKIKEERIAKEYEMTREIQRIGQQQAAKEYALAEARQLAEQERLSAQQAFLQIEEQKVEFRKQKIQMKSQIIQEMEDDDDLISEASDLELADHDGWSDHELAAQQGLSPDTSSLSSTSYEVLDAAHEANGAELEAEEERMVQLSSESIDPELDLREHVSFKDSDNGITSNDEDNESLWSEFSLDLED